MGRQTWRDPCLCSAFTPVAEDLSPAHCSPPLPFPPLPACTVNLAYILSLCRSTHKPLSITIITHYSQHYVVSKKRNLGPPALLNTICQPSSPYCAPPTHLFPLEIPNLFLLICAVFLKEVTCGVALCRDSSNEGLSPFPSFSPLLSPSPTPAAFSLSQRGSDTLSWAPGQVTEGGMKSEGKRGN